MVNQRSIVVLAVFLFFLHAIEEYATGFPTTDSSVLWLSGLINLTSLTVWLSIQVAVFVFLLVLYRFPSQRFLWIVLLVVIVSELSHLLFALREHAYYPGLFTALLLLSLGWLVYRTSFQTLRQPK